MAVPRSVAGSTPRRSGGTGRQARRRAADPAAALALAAFHQMSQPAAIYDGDFRLVCCNAAAVALLGLPPHLAAPGTPLREILLHQAQQGAFSSEQAEARMGEITTMQRIRAEHQLGDGRIVMVRHDALADGGAIVLFNDVTMQRRAEAELQANERRYYAVVEDQTDLILRFAPDGRITFVNSACCRFFALTRDQLRGRDALSLVHPDDRDEIGRYFADPERARHVRTIEHRAPAEAEAEPRWLQRSDRPIRDGGRSVVEFQSVMRDVTELKRAQEQAQRVSNLTTLGQIVAGVTHELNQPLNSAGLTAQNMLMDIEERRDLDAAYLTRKLEVLADDLLRMGEIINHLRTFIRPSPEPGGAVDVAAVVRRAVELVANQFELDAISFDLRLPGACAPVAAGAMDLETVLVNLFTNARDAILRHGGPPGPTGTGAPLRGRIVVAVEDRAPAEVRIAVRDNGGGIPDAMIPRVFDAFVTTKEVGKGMGLGLSIVHRTIANLGGRIAVRNVEGGAEFQITIPAAGRAQ